MNVQRFSLGWQLVLPVMMEQILDEKILVEDRTQALKVFTG